MRSLSLSVCVLLLLLLLLSFCVCERATVFSPLTTEALEQGFLRDGFTVDTWTEYRGFRGARLLSTNATVLSTGLPKRAYYVEGNSYEMGYLSGMLSAPEVEVMTTTYIKHFTAEMISPAWDEKIRKSPLYNDIITLMMEYIVTLCNLSFKDDNEQGLIPGELVEEIQGLSDAVLDQLPSSYASVERLLTLNYGIDWILAHVYRGTLTATFLQHSYTPTAQQTHEENNIPEEAVFLARQFWLNAGDHFFVLPAFCDAYGVSGNATLSGEDVFFARDFQLPVGTVYQDYQAMYIFFPVDGRIPLISTAAPGFVGSVTAMNAAGVAMGVDVLRSGDTRPASPGINSVLLVRHTAHQATSTEMAIDVVVNSARGVSWLYPICDISGDCVVLESGVQLPPDTPFNGLSFVQGGPTGVRHYLPNEKFMEEHNSDDIMRRGLFIRRNNYKYPSEFQDFNPQLFAFADVPYAPDNWNETGRIFSNWTAEHFDDTSKLLDNYFPPQRETFDDVVLTSNLAVVPEIRLAQMSYFANFVTHSAKGTQWRYDSLNNLLVENHGKIDLEKAKDIITFLSPAKSPGYWTDEFIKGEPMTALIEGSISVCDLKAMRIHTLGGYWCDNWTSLTLTNYVSSSPSSSVDQES